MLISNIQDHLAKYCKQNISEPEATVGGMLQFLDSTH